MGGGLDTGEGGGGGGDATGKVATAAFTALNAFSLLPMVHGAQNDGPHLGGAGEGGVDRAHQCGDSRHVRAGHGGARERGVRGEVGGVDIGGHAGYLF